MSVNSPFQIRRFLSGVIVAAAVIPAAAASAAPPPDLPPASAKTQSAIGNVLMVGDSLTVGTGPYLEEDLQGPDVRAYGEVSRSTAANLEVLKAELRKDDVVVVFDTGTNDDPSQPDQLRAYFQEARQMIGDRCMIVATLNRPDYNGISIDGMNDAIERFALSDPTVQLADWHGAVKHHPEVVGGDGVHTTPEGYAARAELMAEAIAACPATTTPASPDESVYEPASTSTSDLSPADPVETVDAAAIQRRVVKLLLDLLDHVSLNQVPSG